MSERLEIRKDFMAVRKGVKITPQGFARIPAALTKSGILEYRRFDGKVIRELRHPDEVNSQESLATLEGASVVVGHDIAEVNLSNYKTTQVGFASDKITYDSNLVLGDLVIQDPETVRRVNSGELKEVSPVYYTKIDPTPGVYEGKPYDQAQTKIRYNNIALGPVGWGRSGPEVSLRLDGVIEEPKGITADNKEEKTKMKITIRLDGQDYAVEVDDAIGGIFRNAITKDAQLRADSEKKAAEASGALVALKSQLEETQLRLDEATSPAALEAAAQERSEVVEKAKAFDKDFRADGLSNEEIKVKVLEAAKVPLLEKTEKNSEAFSAYVSGSFAVLSPPKQRQDSAAFPTGSPEPEKRADEKENEVETASASYKKMVEASQNAWRPREA